MSAMSLSSASVFRMHEASEISFDVARTIYLAAKAAEDAYDKGLYQEAMTRAKQQGEHAVFDDRLTDVSDKFTDARGAAEDILMAIPSPNAQAFALKYVIAHGGGRDTDCWDAMLEAEASRFSSLPVDPHAGWMIERDALLRQSDNTNGISDADAEALIEKANALEALITNTKAATPGGMLVKLILHVGEAAHNGDGKASALFYEAHALGLVEYIG